MKLLDDTTGRLHQVRPRPLVIGPSGDVSDVEVGEFFAWVTEELRFLVGGDWRPNGSITDGHRHQLRTFAATARSRPTRLPSCRTEPPTGAVGCRTRPTGPCRTAEADGEDGEQEHRHQDHWAHTTRRHRPNADEGPMVSAIAPTATAAGTTVRPMAASPRRQVGDHGRRRGQRRTATADGLRRWILRDHARHRRLGEDSSAHCRRPAEPGSEDDPR